MVGTRLAERMTLSDHDSLSLSDDAAKSLADSLTEFGSTPVSSPVNIRVPPRPDPAALPRLAPRP